MCATCHKSGHNKARRTNHSCTDVSLCKLKDEDPDLQKDIWALQRKFKELRQKYWKAKNDNDVFLAARQRAKSGFFAVMRSRLKCQNPAKYIDRGALDRDLMVLQRALQNKVPVDEGLDWRLPGIIEEYKRGNVNVYLSLTNPIHLILTICLPLFAFRCTEWLDISLKNSIKMFSNCKQRNVMLCS